MFSMSLASDALARKISLAARPATPAPDELDQGPKALPLRWGNIDQVLPDGGLPRGVVVEIAAPYGLARATSIALAACASAQAEAKLRGGSAAWCAWIDSSLSLFAPAVARAGVELERLLVVRPSVEDLAKVAARVAASGVFSVIVIDLAGVPGKRSSQRLERWVNPTRRLALAAEGTETTIVLLTDACSPRPTPLPVALRLELDRASAENVVLRVAKDRRGRVAPARVVLPPGPSEGAPKDVRIVPKGIVKAEPRNKPVSA